MTWDEMGHCLIQLIMGFKRVYVHTSVIMRLFVSSCRYVRSTGKLAWREIGHAARWTRNAACLSCNENTQSLARRHGHKLQWMLQLTSEPGTKYLGGTVGYQHGGISTLGTWVELWNINTRNLDLVKKYSDFFTTGKFLKHLGSKFLEGCLLSS